MLCKTVRFTDLGLGDPTWQKEVMGYSRGPGKDWGAGLQGFCVGAGFYECLPVLIAEV